MARRPQTRTAKPISDVDDDVLDEVMAEDRAETARTLGDALLQLRAYTGDKVKGILYQVQRDGKFGWIKDLYPPFDNAVDLEELRDEYGSGNYAIRVFAEGRIKDTAHFSIAGTKKPLGDVSRKSDNMDFIQLMMAQSDRSRSEQTSMMQMMMQQSQQSNQLMMQMMQASSQQMVGLMTAIMAGKSDPTEMAVKMGELLRPREGGMKEAIETLAAAKGLFGDGGGSGPEDTSLMGMAKTFLPVLASGAAELAKNMPQRQEQPQQVLRTVPTPQLIQANPAMAIPPPVETEALTGPDKILALLAPDVLFSMNRGHSPQAAADLVLDTLEKHGITEDEVSSLVVQFVQLGEGWPQYLQQRGIDVSGREAWFNAFISAIVSAYSGEDPQRDGGGQDDAEDHGGSGQSGQTEHEGAPQSA